ncbi:hypothetical protein PR202_gb13332 [Eleusine coracana subsp. coracana]|uniref:Uncharacterized protein n=1 Tax=Eleusine coracana subsp. coracana TaxID=191504 RepID=A0AAV5EQ46_ELECO|nr:hypothetical protein PR202_gb13332 [Eleusine coracana subsp. coracana]
MNDHATQIDDLERVLRDESQVPIKIPYAVIKSITKNFSHFIGGGGFGEVYLASPPSTPSPAPSRYGMAMPPESLALAPGHLSYNNKDSLVMPSLPLMLHPALASLQCLQDCIGIPYQAKLTCTAGHDAQVALTCSTGLDAPVALTLDVG